MNKSFKRIYPQRILYTTILALLSFSSCTQALLETKETQNPCLSDFIKENIILDTVANYPITETLALTGKVEYNPDKVINFVSMVGGVITNTYFTLGEEVKKGQVLAEIKSTELGHLLSQKRSLQSQISVAQRTLESTLALYQDKVASEKNLVEAQSSLDILNAELENVETQLSLFSASSERGVFQIKAPASGIIVHKNIVPGMQVSTEGEALFTISDRSEVWIMANVYAGNIPHVKEHMEAKIKALAYPDELFSGKINLLAQVFDTEERVLKARIVMDNTNNKLIPGMLVDVAVEKDLGRFATAAPGNALIFDNNQHFLLIYKSDCDIEARPVHPSIQNAEHVFVEENLQVGEKIIAKNHLLIYNHLKALN